MDIPAGKFKAKCLELMDQVRDAKVEYTITKHGKPVAKLVPIQDDDAPEVFGCLKDQVTEYGDIVSPVDENWDADASS